MTAPVFFDLGGVAQLVGPLRSAGLPVTVEVLGAVSGRGDEAELFAQRILMEARRRCSCKRRPPSEDAPPCAHP